MLKPYVCDCAGADTAVADNCPAPAPVDTTAVVELSQQTTFTAVARARAAATGSDDPSLRTIERGQKAEPKPAEPEHDPLELYDPTVAEALVPLDDVDARDRIKQTFSVTLPDAGEGTAFSGNFSTKEGLELLVVRPNNTVSVYGADGRIARMELGGEAAADEFASLEHGPEQPQVRAVRMVRDGTLQLLMHWREQTEAGGFAYKVGAFKVMGPFFGKIFVRTLATRAADDEELIMTGTYEFLRGDTHRQIRWIPANAGGELQPGEAVVLEWNKWEGVFRVPRPAPTAPKRDKMRSEHAPSEENSAQKDLRHTVALN